MDQRTRDGRANRHPGVTERDGRCRIEYRDAAGQRRFKLTTYKYSQAGIKLAARHRNQLEKAGGELAASAQEKRAATPTYAQLAQVWLDRRGISATTRRTAKSRLNTYLMPAIGGLPVDQVTFEELQQLVNELPDTLKPKSIRNILADGRAVLQLAVKGQHLASNPFDLLDRVKVPKDAPDPFTQGERDQLLGWLSGNAWLFSMIKFYAGLRPGEVIGLRWSDYNPETGELHVRRQIVEGEVRETTKTAQARHVALHPTIREALRDWPSRFAGGYVFLKSNGERYGRPRHLSNKLVDAMGATGVRYRSPYNARHTCASMMLSAGMDPAYCAEQLGHSLEMFLRVYSRWIDDGRSAKQAAIWEQQA